MKRDVFISYHSDMREEACALREFLKKEKISCWMAPDDLPRGKEYADVISNAIADCAVFLPILSEKANESVWLFKELDIAINAEKIIMPFSVDQCALTGSMGFYLADVKRYGKEDGEENTLEQLAADIRRVARKVRAGKWFFTPWVRFGPYKMLSDREEFLAMNAFTLGCVPVSIRWLYLMIDTDFWKEPELLLITLSLFIPWLLGGKIAQKIARRKNKLVIALHAFVSSYLLSVATWVLSYLVMVIIYAGKQNIV